LRLVGAGEGGARPAPIEASPGLHSYGSEQDLVLGMPGATVLLVPGLTEGMVRFAVRHEYARCVEDVLARRSRLLFLDAAAAAAAAPRVGEIVAEETGRDPQTGAFLQLAQEYLQLPG
jgi:glycerol-3-phosphate dehydrogenase